MAFLKFYRVRGRSMEPIAHEGDYIFVRKFFPWEKPLENDRIIALDPRDPSRILLKRIVGIQDDKYNIIGDNKKESTDSRTFGLVPRNMIHSKIIVRICA